MIDLMAAARELSKMRLLAQSVEYRRDLPQSFAECLFLDKYGKLPSVADLKRDSKRKVNLVPKDENGALIRTIASDLFPFRVYRNWCNADIYVFIKTGRPLYNSVILGWLPRELVLSMPTEPVPDRPDDFFFSVESAFLIKMPDSFAFEEPDHHKTGDWNGIWDMSGGWECFTCGRLIPDEITRQSVERMQ